jgi:hypothetical protein
MPSTIQNSRDTLPRVNIGPAAMGSFQSRNSTRAKKASEMTAVTTITGTPPIREPATGEAWNSSRRVRGNRIAATMAAPQTTTRASIRLRKAMLR